MHALMSVVSLGVLWLLFAVLPWGEDDQTPLEKCLRWIFGRM